MHNVSKKIQPEKDKKSVALPCYVEDEQQISNYIGTYLREAGYGCDRDALLYLAKNLVGDRMLAKRQLEKSPAHSMVSW